MRMSMRRRRKKKKSRTTTTALIISRVYKYRLYGYCLLLQCEKELFHRSVLLYSMVKKHG